MNRSKDRESFNSSGASSSLKNAENKLKEKLEEMKPILSKTQLKNLDAHKYSASGSTLLDPLFQPYWNWLVLQIPLYIAPNLLTITGLIVNVVTSVILMLYSPNIDQPVRKKNLKIILKFQSDLNLS
jgi:hypothetical protein